jgi:hypothetical protein
VLHVSHRLRRMNKTDVERLMNLRTRTYPRSTSLCIRRSFSFVGKSELGFMRFVHASMLVIEPSTNQDVLSALFESKMISSPRSNFETMPWCARRAAGRHFLVSRGFTAEAQDSPRVFDYRESGGRRFPPGLAERCSTSAGIDARLA